MLNTEPQWVAVYTKARAEQKLADQLAEKNIESYCPTVRQTHKWSDRIKVMEVPLFASYCFARITRDQVSKVRSMPAAVFIVAFGGKIATVPDNDIEVIRIALQSQQDFILQQMEKLKSGAHVRVLDGLFKDKEGILIDETKDGKNFGVKIEALSSVFVVKINKNLLELVEDETEDNDRKKKECPKGDTSK